MQQNNLILQNQLLQQNQIEEENYTFIEIDNKNYAIKTSNVLEILKIMELDYPNVMPSCILGILKYEQSPIGVIDLREIFKNKRVVYDLSAKLLVLKTENSINAIICDKVTDIKKLDKKKIHALPYSKETDFFDGVYINSDDNIYIMNVENIFNFIEQNSDKFPKNTENNYIVNDEASKEILKERKNLLSKTTEDIQSVIPLYDRGVSFIINDIKYYINMASVKEFYKVNNSKFIKVPNTPDYIFGLINIKGDYVTVLDIRRFFNTSGASVKEKSTIIILNSAEYKIGILADEICESMNVDFDEIIQNRINNQEDNKMMEFVKDGEIYQVLDIETLLKDERLIIC